MRKAVCLVAMVTVPLSAVAQVTQKGDGYLFRMKFTKGKVVNYGLTSTTVSPLMQNSMSVLGGFSILVKDVAQNIGNLTFKMSDMKSSNGTKVMPGRSIDVKVDNQGRPKSNSLSATGVTQSLTGVTFPDRPVKVGETWKGSMEADPGGFNMKLFTTYRLLKLDGKVASVAVTQTSTGAMRITGKGVAEINIQDGFLQRLTLDQTTIIKNPQNKTSITVNSKSIIIRK